ncbi:MAG: 50S ribosomal protein L15 [Alphaproteobacteria bacterium]|nr:50S ribosomal protein L15 [Alphaproteobacteria bacterium]
MQLNDMSDNPGARKPPRRLGRGIGSTKGKTAGRGHKGAKARAGSSVQGFEGGQMPIYRRVPKRGFNVPFAPIFVEVNLDRLQQAIDRGRLDPAQLVDGAALKAAGLARRLHDGVRLLGRGTIKRALTIEVAGASKSAIAAIEAAGGKVIVKARETAAGAQGAEA